MDWIFGLYLFFTIATLVMVSWIDIGIIAGRVKVLSIILWLAFFGLLGLRFFIGE